MNKIRDDATKNKQNAYRLKTEQPKKIDTDNERNARMQNMNKVGHIHCDAVVDAYRREVKKFVGLVQKMGWKLDWSRVDYAATKELLKSGYRADLLEKAIIETSPGLADRHADVVRYARDTVCKATADTDVIQHLKTQELQAQRSSGNGQKLT